MSQARFVSITNLEKGEKIIQKVRWCQNWFCRWKGLQFRRNWFDNEGLLLVFPEESVTLTSIHMLFVFVPLAAIWIDTQQRVTWVQLARPWHLRYASPTPARYVLEAPPEILQRVAVGDRLEFIPYVNSTGTM